MKVTVTFDNENEFYEFLKFKKDRIFKSVAEEFIDDLDTSLDEISIERLLIGERTKNCLIYEDIKTIGAADKLSDTHLLKIPNMGRKSLTELRAAIAHYKSLVAKNA